MDGKVYLIMEERISKRRNGAVAGTHSAWDFKQKTFAMARNLGHAGADDTANETKNVSHNILNYGYFPMKTVLKSRLPP